MIITYKTSQVFYMFSPRNYILNKRAIRRFISLFAKKDNWHNLIPEKANMGYAFIHYSLIRNQLPKKVLCIGSKYGYIPATCAMACRDNNYGKVYFVDAGFDYEGDSKEDSWGGVGLWRRINEKEYFGRFNLEKFISLNVMTTQEFSKKKINNNWDYLYIDGDHSYEGIKYDFKTFWPKLKKGAYCLFHDTNIDFIDDDQYGVKKLLSEIKDRKDLQRIDIPGEYGLTIVQKIK